MFIFFYCTYLELYKMEFGLIVELEIGKRERERNGM